MKLLETKTIQIGDKSYNIKLSTRAMMNYEELSGHSINQAANTIKDRTMIFFCCLKVCGYEQAFEQFLDLIDDKPEKIGEFIEIVFVNSEKKPKAR